MKLDLLTFGEKRDLERLLGKILRQEITKIVTEEIEKRLKLEAEKNSQEKANGTPRS